MLHYILVFLSYIAFIGIINSVKSKSNTGEQILLSKPIGFGMIFLLLLTGAYEIILLRIIGFKVSTKNAYITMSVIGSALYAVLFFVGLLIIAKLMKCKAANGITYCIFVLALIFNIAMVMYIARINYDAIENQFSNGMSFFDAISTVDDLKFANILSNIKWIIMIVPGVVYLVQIIKDLKK